MAASRRVEIRINKTDYKEIKRLAGLQGLSVSEYMRRRALKKEECTYQLLWNGKNYGCRNGTIRYPDNGDEYVTVDCPKCQGHTPT